jgi:DNA-binding transcriptional MerR regulator
VNSSGQFLNPSEAANRLGVSAKALRVYEQRGLVAPVRTAAGWRAYGPNEIPLINQSTPSCTFVGMSTESPSTSKGSERCGQSCRG